MVDIFGLQENLMDCLIITQPNGFEGKDLVRLSLRESIFVKPMKTPFSTTV